MSKITFEQTLAWTQPQDYEIIGRATSIDELEPLRAQYEQEHRDFVLSELRAELARRSGILPPEPEHESIDFSQIPLQLVVTRNKIGELAKSDYLPDTFKHLKRTDFTHAWMVFAQIQAELGGHSFNATKHNIATDDVTFDERFARSVEISSSGYPVRFLMNGVKHIQSSALDLETVQKWIDTRAKWDNNYVFEPSDYPPIYGVSWGLWPDVITAKRRYDAANGLSAYSDVVNEVAGGVYLAPYIPDGVASSPDFVTYDDVHREIIRSGNISKNASLVFMDFVRYAIPSLQTRGALWPYFQAPQSVRSGTFFLERAVLEDAIERKYDSYIVKQAGQSNKVAKAMETVLEQLS